MFTKEQLTHDAWRRGILSYKFKPIQHRLYQAFHEAKTRLFVSLIARQTGKSFHWASLAIETAIRKPQSRIRYATAFESDLREFIIPVFNTITADCPKSLAPKFKRQGSKWVFPNGSEIKLVGLDRNPNGLRGNALDLVIIDEAGFVDNLSYTYRSVIIPMLRNRPHLRIAMSSTPGESPDHDFKEFCEKAEVEGGYFKATIDDDETVTPEIRHMLLEECGGADSTNWRREFLCEWVTDEELAIIPEWDDRFIESFEPCNFRQYYHNYVAMDIGGTTTTADFTAHNYGYYNFTRAALMIEDETHVRGPMSTTDNIAKMVKAKEHELWGQKDQQWNPKRVYQRISDNNNPILINDLGVNHNLHFMPTNKDELPAMINEVRLMVKPGRIIVHPRCKHTIGCLRNGIYNSKKIKREFARSKVLGHYDWLASLVYLVRNLDTHTNPIPDLLGVHESTHHIRPGAREKTHKIAEIMGKTFVAKN